jgi:serine/threonine-protein kinase
MSDEKDKVPPEENEERTVFIPGGLGGTTPPPAPPPPPEPTAPVADPAAIVPSENAAQIKVGDVLNHIFKVDRFLARGGMGEVFEGCNINTDEKVAIKVMLPALASDPKVIEMFRKEARTLTKLHHQAIVPYRVLAQDQELKVLYIVTDFIEGANLRDVLGTLQLPPDRLAALLRRLAGGLAEAHELGAVHRDISPDNILLENDDIEDAKIIDFGIAKDLDAGAKTIVGDGFAGKLNYVAPEQLGDFGREIGPWTDVYSLGLVILAAAQGKNVDMSGSLVDAIDKRRRGPDLAAVPDTLRPLLAAMLRPNPAERLRSMDDVIKMLDGARIPSAQTVRERLPPPETAATLPGGSAGRTSGNSLVIILIVLAIVAALAGGAWYLGLFDGGGGGGQSSSGGGPPVPDNRPPEEIARAAVSSILPSVPCTWLDIGRIENGDSGVTVAMRGVAGNREAAQAEIGRALSRAGLANAEVRFADVAEITQAGCSALDSYRQVHADPGGHIGTARAHYEMVTQADGPYRGGAAANALVDLNVDPDTNFALLGIEPSGQISTILASRADFRQTLAQSQGGRPISDEGNGRYRVHIDLDHQGWSGLLLITGRGPFDPALVAPAIGARGPDWQQRFLANAAANGWHSEMVWFESINREPDADTGGDEGSGDEGGK